MDGTKLEPSTGAEKFRVFECGVVNRVGVKITVRLEGGANWSIFWGFVYFFKKDILLMKQFLDVPFWFALDVIFS